MTDSFTLVRQKRAWAAAGATAAAVSILTGMIPWGPGSPASSLVPASLGCLVCCLVARTMWTWERLTVNRFRVAKVTRLLGYFFALAQLSTVVLTPMLTRWGAPLWLAVLTIILALATGFMTVMAISRPSSRTWPPRSAQELPRYEPQQGGWSGPAAAPSPEHQNPQQHLR